MLLLAAFSQNGSAQRNRSRQLNFDFNTTNLPAGTTLHEQAYIGSDGTLENGCLHLTDPQSGTSGQFRIPNIGEGMTVTRMQIQWRSWIGGGEGADGYSLNWGTDLPKTPGYANPGEEGAGSGLSVTVDTFDNGDDLVGLDIRWQSNVVASVAVPPSALRKDDFVEATLTVSETGLVTLNYDSRTLTVQLTNWLGITRGDIVLGARTGAYSDRHWIDDLEIHPEGANPGTYAGLYYDEGNWQHTNSGSINLKVTPLGAYSGSLSTGGTKLPFTGQFDLFTLTSLAQVTLPGGPATTLHLAFDGNDTITGSVSNEVWDVPLTALRQVWDKKRNPATNHVGRYVFAVFNPPGGPTVPGGAGYGTVVVDAAGGVKFAGVLGDGTKVSQKTFLSQLGEWPIYIATHGGKGSFQGWTQAENSDGNEAELGWFKQPGASSPIYPGGFSVHPNSTVAPYTPPALGERILPFFVGEAVFNYDGDGTSLNFGLTRNNQFIDLGAGDYLIAAKFAPKTGLFNGTLTFSGNGTRIKFGGVALAAEEIGVGHFLGPDQSGLVTLSALAGSP